MAYVKYSHPTTITNNTNNSNSSCPNSPGNHTSAIKKKKWLKSIYYNNVANIVCLFWFNDIDLLINLFNNSTTSTTALSHLSVPTSSFKQFVINIIDQTQFPPTSVSLALFYILRLKSTSQRSIIGCANSEFRIFSVALMLANKFLDDNTYTNKTWSEITKLPLNEITKMEVEFLTNIRYSLIPNQSEWSRWQLNLKVWLNIHARHTTNSHNFYNNRIIVGDNKTSTKKRSLESTDSPHKTKKITLTNTIYSNLPTAASAAATYSSSYPSPYSGSPYSPYAPMYPVTTLVQPNLELQLQQHHQLSQPPIQQQPQIYYHVLKKKKNPSPQIGILPNYPLNNIIHYTNQFELMHYMPTTAIKQNQIYYSPYQPLPPTITTTIPTFYSSPPFL